MSEYPDDPTNESPDEHEHTGGPHRDPESIAKSVSDFYDYVASLGDTHFYTRHSLEVLDPYTGNPYSIHYSNTDWDKWPLGDSDLSSYLYPGQREKAYTHTIKRVTPDWLCRGLSRFALWVARVAARCSGGSLEVR
jgi:hypothetical protein